MVLAVMVLLVVNDNLLYVGVPESLDTAIKENQPNETKDNVYKSARVRLRLFPAQSLD